MIREDRSSSFLSDTLNNNMFKYLLNFCVVSCMKGSVSYDYIEISQ